MLALVLLLGLVISSLPPSLCASVLSISCSSEVTPVGGGVCVGVPVKCTLTLNATECDSGGSVASLSMSDLTVQITQAAMHMPDFVVDQAGATVVIIADFSPSPSPSTVDVAISSSNADCAFSEALSSVPVESPASCSYPISFILGLTSPDPTERVRGGDIITVSLNVSVTDPIAVEDVTVAYSLLHPSLEFLSADTMASDPGISITSPVTGTSDDRHNLLSSTFTPLVLVSSITQNDVVTTTLTFQVQPYVLPRSTLYISLHLFYHYPSSFSTYSLQQSIDQLRGYQASGVTVRKLTIDLPYYDTQDYEPDTFPPQEGDTFTVTVPIRIPCVSTDLTVNLVLSEFLSDLGTRYYVDVANVSFTAPSNLMSIPQLCDYTDRDASMCDFSNLSGTGPAATSSISFAKQSADGNDDVTVDFGPLMYDITTGSVCAGTSPPSSCSCDDNELQIIFIVVSLTDMICGNQTISDNITTTLIHTADMTSWSAPDLTHTEPTITQYQRSVSSRHAVNASTPAISLPISSHTVDAGDNLTVTFEVVHDAEYSKFTAYDVNYTFSIDPRLVPGENVTICFHNTTDESSPVVICEDVSSTNLTIEREGFHEVFSLHTHRVELMLNVTVVQEVAPGISFSNLGSTIFSALPVDNLLNITPLTCTNTSSGSVSILPVIVSPWVVHWSNVDPTATEDFPVVVSEHHVTRDEQFNTTVKACLPECLTGLDFYVIIPTDGGEPVLTVDDAYVTSVGSDLLNATLSPGDALNTSANITVQSSGTAVRFFFGSEVLVPISNTSESDKKCFEVGLLFTVSNSFVTHGERFSYSAYTETDLGVRSTTQNNTLLIVEPTLVTTTTSFLGTFDAGDTVTSVVTVSHSSSSPLTHGYRLNLTVTYPTEYFYLNESNANSTLFFLNGGTQLFNVTVNSTAGEVVFSLDEFGATDTLEVTTVFILTNSVRNRQLYNLDHVLDWHNLPYELPAEGRYYTTSRTQLIFIASSQLVLDITTSADENTLNDFVQLQEYLYMNLTITLPEGVSPTTIRLSHINLIPGAYPFNFTYGEVVKIGSSISNTSLDVGDNTTINSSGIDISEVSAITFFLGDNVVNSYDNIVDEGDKILLYIEGYTSNLDGSSLNVQIIALLALDPNFNFGFAILRLVHPQLQIESMATPPGPWDAGDLVNLAVNVSMTPVSTGHVAYDLLLRVELDSGPLQKDLVILNTTNTLNTTAAAQCTSNVSKVDHYQLIVSNLLADCIVQLHIGVTLSDLEVVAGENITVAVTLTEYYAVTLEDAVLARINYGPISTSLSEPTKIPSQVLLKNTSHPLNYTPPFQTVELTYTLTVPEGQTRDVCVVFNLTVLPPGDPAAISLSLNLESSAIYPVSNNTSLPFIGDLLNPADNILSANDTVEFIFTLDIPDMSGTPFKVSVTTTYNTSSGEQQLVDELDFVIVRPDVNVTTNALSERLSRVVLTETIEFDLQIERVDSTFPDYDILIDVSLQLPPLNASLDELPVNSVVSNDSGVWLSLNRSVLSYINGTTFQQFHFEGHLLTDFTDVSMVSVTGSVSYVVDPYTNSDYVEYITFPELYFVKPKLAAGTLCFYSFFEDSNNNEIVVWKMVFSEVAGPPYDLTMDIQVDSDVVLLRSIEIQSIGSSLVFQSPALLVNTSSQAQLVFQNLTLNESPSVCLSCSKEVALLVYTQLVSEVGKHSVLVNATSSYFSATAVLEARNSLIEVSYENNNTDSRGGLQVGERVLFNITISPPENMTTNSTLNVTLSQSSPLDYTVIFSSLEILHIGANVHSSSVSVGDSTSSPHILLSSNEVIIDLGEVSNAGDGVMDESDHVVVQVTAHALDTGTSLANQTVIFNCFLEGEQFIRDTVSLQLIHPQLEMNIADIAPPGPWDARDLIIFTISLSHLDLFQAATAYDLQFSFKSNDYTFTSLTIGSINATGLSCPVYMLTCVVSSVDLLVCDSLPAGCHANITLWAELPLMVIAGSEITTATTLLYSSSPHSSPHPRVNYGPINDTFIEAVRVPTQTLYLSTDYPLVNTTLNVTVEVIFSEGVTANVSTRIEAWDNSSCVSLNFTLQSISAGGHINLTSVELLDLFPTFGDVFVLADNNSTLELDTLTITYSAFQPEAALLANFTVLVDTSFTTSENAIVHITNTDTWLVVEEPSVDLELSLSDRLVDVGYSMLYNVTLVYSYDLGLGGTASLHATGFLPSFLAISPNELVNQTSQYTEMSGLDYMEVTFADLEIDSLFADHQILLNVSITPNATNQTRIIATVGLEFTYSLILGVFGVTGEFPDAYLPNLNMTTSLLSTSYSFTEGSIVTLDEVTVWQVTLAGVVGPAQDLTVAVFSDYEHLNMAGLRVSSIGLNLTTTGAPVAMMVGETAVFMFPGLTLTNPEGYNGSDSSCDSDIVVEVEVTPLLAVTENRPISLCANVTYGSLQRKSCGDLLITPPANLTLNLTLAAEEEVQGGVNVSATAVIQHISVDPVDAYDLLFTFPGKDYQLAVSDNATASFSNGTTVIFDSEVLFDGGGGFNISLLQWNETVAISVLYTFVPLTILGRVVTFTAQVEYSNTNMSTPGYRHRASSEEYLMLRSLGDLQRELATTSCSYTVGNELAINEIFEVAVLNHIQHGVSSPQYRAIISTDSGASLPLTLLNTSVSVPSVPTFQTTTNITIDVQHNSPSELVIIWNLGIIHNLPDGRIDDDDLTTLRYTFGVVENASLTDTILIKNKVVSMLSNETEVAHNLTLPVIEPELTAVIGVEVLEEGNPRISRFTATILHTENSTAPAFSLSITNYVPLELSVVSLINITHPEGDDVLNISSNENDNIIEVTGLILPLGLNVTVVYLSQMNASLPDDVNATSIVELQYTTVEQEGIGLLYPEYDGREQNHSIKVCIRKDITRIEVALSGYYQLLIWLVAGICIGVVLSTIAVVVYHCSIYARGWRKKRRVIPALLFGILQDNQEEEYQIFKSGGKRALFSSLLIALPKDEWFDTEDTYAGAESDYIAEVEGDLFHFEIQAINRLLLYLLQTDTGLKLTKIRKAKFKFDFKAKELRNNLRQSMHVEMQKAAFQSVSDKMTKTENLTASQDEIIQQFQSTSTLNLETTGDVLEYLNKEHELEVRELYSITGLEKKEAGLILTQQYMTHFILGIKAIVLRTLKKFCPKGGNMVAHIQELSDELGRAILSEMSAQEELSVSRGKRQRQCLLEKKLVEEEDIHWEERMLKLINNSLSSIKHAHMMLDGDALSLYKEFMNCFHTEMEQLRSHKKELELEISNKALSELQRREEQLPVFRFQDSLDTEFSSVCSEIERWGTIQHKREQALKEVEEQAVKELTECWKKHVRARNQLLEEQTTKLAEHMLSRGVPLQVCDEILRQHSKKRLKVKEKLEASSLIQRAKFQARVERQRKRMRDVIEANHELYSSKMEVEKHFLVDVISGMDSEDQLEKIEQYHKDVAVLQRSVALERLRIYLRTKARVSALVKKQLQTTQTKCLQTLQNRENKSSTQKVQEVLSSFVKQRKKVNMESYTKMLEEEVKRAEEDYIKEREREIAQVINRSIETVLSEEEKAAGQIITSQPNSERLLQLDVSNVQEETKKLLMDHRQHLLSVNNKLEAEKQNVAKTFEKKLEKRRLQRVKAVMDLAVPDTGSRQIAKPMRFVAAVRKVMLSVRMQSIREQHRVELENALEELQNSYEQKKHEAFSKLERKLENHLLNIGKLSNEELIQVFQSVDTWRTQLKKPKNHRSRRFSAYAGPLNVQPQPPSALHMRQLTCPEL